MRLGEPFGDSPSTSPVLTGRRSFTIDLHDPLCLTFSHFRRYYRPRLSSGPPPTLSEPPVPTNGPVPTSPPSLLFTGVRPTSTFPPTPSKRLPTLYSEVSLLGPLGFKPVSKTRRPRRSSTQSYEVTHSYRPTTDSGEDLKLRPRVPCTPRSHLPRGSSGNTPQSLVPTQEVREKHRSDWYGPSRPVDCRRGSLGCKEGGRRRHRPSAPTRHLCRLKKEGGPREIIDGVLYT